MIARGTKLRQKNTIQITSDEAKILGKELIYLAEETEDHQWRHVTKVIDEKILETLINIVIKPSGQEENEEDSEFEIQEEMTEQEVIEETMKRR